MEKQKMAENITKQYVDVYLDEHSYSKESELNELIDKVIGEVMELSIMQNSSVDEEDLNQSLRFYLKDYFSFDDEVSMLSSGEHNAEWLNGHLPQTDWQRWHRLRNYLINRKGRTAGKVNRLNTVSHEILSQLGNPVLDEEFDRKGLVVGYVQSGKTENYIALINKSLDVGYKLVIVLSGMHNDLRNQTQKRIDAEVIGIDSEDYETTIGVGKVEDLETVHSLTQQTDDGDINSHKSTSGLHYSINNENPTIIVTKKVSSVLESAKTLLKKVDKNIPILIIDDEADQASIDVTDSIIDSSHQDYEPSSINRLIREIYLLFKKRAYIGYTATPFANVLITHKTHHPKYGDDLFPKDFIINLDKNKDYLGPDELFGFENGEGLPLIRQIDDPEIAEEDVFERQEVPKHLSDAIKSYIISTAVRHLRGQVNTHNSMLIHINRSIDSQSKIAKVVTNEFSQIKSQIQMDNESLVHDLQRIWKKDYVPTSLDMQVFNEVEPWGKVVEEIKNVVNLIEIMTINGESDDRLDYEKHKQEGLYAIVIGGDKLSRGLTLDGLTVSYYLRSSKAYDTLMQMGRWFGYKKGFEDLCRLYISPDLASNFRAIAIANSEFRELVDTMQEEGRKPVEFGLRIRSHTFMNVTNILKLKNAITSIEMKSFAGRKPQTIDFYNDKEVIEQNYQKTIDFFDTLSKYNDTFGTKGMIRLWNEVSPETVINYLEKLQVPDYIMYGSPQKWLSYIKHELGKEEIYNFKVFLMSNQIHGDPITVGEHVCNRPGRRQVENENDSITSIGVLRSGQDLKNITSFLDEDLEEVEKPILLVYPIVITEKTTRQAIEDFNQKIIGLSIVFPKSKTQDVEYTENTVMQEE